jgi:hypothetical protein
VWKGDLPPTSSTETTATTTTVSTTTTAATASVTSHVLQLGRHDLISLLEDCNEIASRLGVFLRKECNSGTSCACTTSTTDTVDVVFSVVWEVVVQNVCNVLDI